MTLPGEDVAVLLRIVEDTAGAPDHARHRIFVQVDREAGLLLEQHVEAADQRPTPGHHDASVYDIARELRRRDFQGAAHGIDDLLNRLLDRLPNLARMHPHDLRDPGHAIPALDLHLALLAHR